MVCCKFRLTSYHYQWIKWFSGIQDLLSSIYRIFMRILSPLTFIGANLLIISVASLFVFLFIPEIAHDSYFLYLLHMAFGVYLLINIFFNYFACSFIQPGSPSYCPDPGRILGEKVSIVDGRRIYQFSYQLNVAPFVSYKYCHVCKCIKPPRCHHDSVSSRCVLNMDHYCPWMNTCVGYYNYRYFMLFLIFLNVGCLYVIGFLLGDLVDISKVDRSFIRLSSAMQSNLYFNYAVTASSYSFALAVAAFCSTGILLVWHAYLIFTNQTTIEFFINLKNRQEATSSGLAYKNPFDEGLRKNFKRVFGDVAWYKNLWPSLHLPPEPKFPFELSIRDLKDSYQV